MSRRPLTIFRAHASQHPALTGGNVAMISGENPRFPAQMQGHEDLRNELDRLGLDHEETQGHYGAPERSFIVNNPSLPQMLQLGRKFGQESIAFSQNGRHQLHYTNGPDAGMATPPAEGHNFSDKQPEDFYTAVPGTSGEPLGYFSWNIDFANPKVPSQAKMPTQQAPAQPTNPMTKSELAIEVEAWMERLGALRTRELAKGIEEDVNADAARTAAKAVKPENYKHATAAGRKDIMRTLDARPTVGAKPPAAKMTVQSSKVHDVLRRQAMVKSEGDLAKKAPPGFSEETMHELKRKHGVESAFKIAWASHNKKMGKAEPTPTDAYFHPSEKNAPKKPALAGPPAVNTYRAVPKDYKKGEQDAGGVAAMISGDITKMKKSDASERANIGRVRDAEDKELANVPVRDLNKPHGFAPQSGKVSSIAEERQMGKSESSKVDPLDADMASQHSCKGCKASMSPVVAALRKSHGGMCLKCAGSMAKGELKYHNNEPQREAEKWEPKCKVVEATGSGGTTKKNPIGNSENDGAKSVTLPMGKAEGMPVPSAPKAPQAPGAMPAKSGGTTKPAGSSVSKPAPVSGGMPAMKSEVTARLHKSIKDAGRPLQKAMNAGAMTRTSPAIRQASFDASKETGLPAAGKVTPKSPAEYDAAAFRPASPGAAGAPSGLELDTSVKKFPQGNQLNPQQGATAIPTKSLGGKPQAKKSIFQMISAHVGGVKPKV